MGLGITLSNLIAEVEREPHVASRRFEQLEWRDPESGYSLACLLVAH
jgi:hypothetical protein